MNFATRLPAFRPSAETDATFASRFSLSSTSFRHATIFIQTEPLLLSAASDCNISERSTLPFVAYIAAMGLSKSTRIMILLGIDSAFFFLELVVGIQ